MEDEVFKSQANTTCQSQAIRMLGEESALLDFTSCLPNRRIKLLLEQLDPTIPLQEMSCLELQTKLIEMAKTACSVEPLEFIKDLNCLVETIDQERGNAEICEESQATSPEHLIQTKDYLVSLALEFCKFYL